MCGYGNHCGGDGMSGPVVIDLSRLPPSVNRQYGRTPSGGVYLKPKVRSWRADMGWEIQGMKIRRDLSRIDRPYTLKILLAKPDNRKRDADNFIKEVSDLLVRHGLVKDDSLARSVSAEWSDLIAVGCRVILTPVEA